MLLQYFTHLNFSSVWSTYVLTWTCLSLQHDWFNPIDWRSRGIIELVSVQWLKSLCFRCWCISALLSGTLISLSQWRRLNGFWPERRMEWLRGFIHRSPNARIFIYRISSQNLWGLIYRCLLLIHLDMWLFLFKLHRANH